MIHQVVITTKARGLLHLGISLLNSNFQVVHLQMGVFILYQLTMKETIQASS